MIVSGINSNTNVYQANTQHTKFRQIKDNFQQLDQALQAGNLNGAQQAFAALQQLMPDLSLDNKIQNGQTSIGHGLFKTDFNAIGLALKSGDLTGAKAAFAKLQQDIQSVHKGRHSHNNHPNVGGSQNSIPVSNGSSSLTNISSGNSRSTGNNINLTA
ncbi:MAG TPA: hypothetical protein VEF33_08160 [Syntrophales bacterium]|nr:hypothetical protein [Syntrophales bacterium]